MSDPASLKTRRKLPWLVFIGLFGLLAGWLLLPLLEYVFALNRDSMFVARQVVFIASLVLLVWGLASWAWRDRSNLAANAGAILIVAGLLMLAGGWLAGVLAGIIAGGFVALTGAVLSLKK